MPWGLAAPGAGPLRPSRWAPRPGSASSPSAGALLALFETAIAKMRVFRVPEFLGAALMLGLLGDAAAVRVAEPLMDRLAFDIAHLLAGGLVLVSFMLLYQDRLYALLNIFALHALVLSLSVAWQAYIQDAPHLYVTAAIALVFKAIIDSGARCTASSSGSASIARSRPWSASAPPCWPAWAWSRCRSW